MTGPARRLARPASVLLVADADVVEAFRALDLPQVPIAAADVGEARAALGRTPPDFVLLDLDLAGGDELVVRIKDDPARCHIPVVAFARTLEDERVLERYRRHVNCLLRRPARADALARLVQEVAAFWFGAGTVLPIRPESLRE